MTSRCDHADTDIPICAEPGKESGFTLVELLVCLAILALMAVVVPMPFSHRSGLADASADIAGALRDTRERAIQTGRPALFSIDYATGSFEGPQGIARNLPPNIRVLPASVSSGNHDGQTILRFFPDGSADGTGLILAADDSQREITVDWLTGKVRISAHSGR